MCNVINFFIKKHYGSPQKSFESIHIAGLNGKTSVATKLAQIFSRNYFEVGLFTAPHIFSFRERISTNDVLISEEFLVNSLDHLFRTSHLKNWPLTVHEYITLSAFLYFKEKKCEIVILETGFGGRLDPTNVVTPIL